VASACATAGCSRRPPAPPHLPVRPARGAAPRRRAGRPRCRWWSRRGPSGRGRPRPPGCTPRRGRAPGSGPRPRPRTGGTPAPAAVRPVVTAVGKEPLRSRRPVTSSGAAPERGPAPPGPGPARRRDAAGRGRRSGPARARPPLAPPAREPGPGRSRPRAAGAPRRRRRSCEHGHLAPEPQPRGAHDAHDHGRVRRSSGPSPRASPVLRACGRWSGWAPARPGCPPRRRRSRRGAPSPAPRCAAAPP